MRKHFDLRRLASLVVAAATLLVLAPSGIAQAAETPITVPESRGADTLTVTGDFDSMKGHQYRALRIGKYATALGVIGTDPTKDGVLTDVTVETIPTVKSSAADALQQVTHAAPDSGFPDNPVGEVANKWSGFAGSDSTSDSVDKAWSGDLRDFVTAFVAEPAFATLIRQSYVPKAKAPQTANEPNGKASFKFKHILPGIYVVVDVTGLQNVPVPDVMHNPNADLSTTPAPDDTTALRDSIAMMTETAITTAAGKKYTSQMNGKPLGQVDLKSDRPGMTMEASTSSALVGDSISYTLRTHVPLTTGFPVGQYLFTVVDTPDVGLTFDDPDSVKIRLTIHDTAAGQSLQRENPAPKDYSLDDPELNNLGFKHAEFPASDTARSGDTKFVAVDFTPMLKQLKFGEDIAITFKMKITDHATNLVKNVARLYFSSDPANPYTGVVATLAETGSVTHWVPSTPLQPATPKPKPPKPSKPEKPSKPSVPSTPLQPAKPTPKPPKPPKPSKPEKPSVPSTPLTPAKPTPKPPKPSVPSTPLKPATPVCPTGQKPDENHHCSPVDHNQPPEVVTYLRHIDLLSLDKKDKNKHLKGTQFKIKLDASSAKTRSSEESNDYLEFRRVGDGNYRVVAPGTPSQTDTITVCGKNIRTGDLKIYGLADNATYDVEEVTRPTGYPYTPLVKFNVSVMGSRRDPSIDVYHNTTDMLHLDLVDGHKADTDPDVVPIDVYAISSLAELPATGDIWIILAVVIAVLLLLAVAILAAIRRHRAQQAALRI